jgi:hypothetical protein
MTTTRRNSVIATITFVISMIVISSTIGYWMGGISTRIVPNTLSQTPEVNVSATQNETKRDVLFPNQFGTYIIFQNDLIYCAQNGLTGAIDYNNTDAATVINWALTAIPDWGTVKVNGMLRLDNSVTIDGAVIGYKNLELDFDGFYLGADVDAIVINNFEAFEGEAYFYFNVKVCGKIITANKLGAALDHTHSLVRFGTGTGSVYSVDVDIGTLAGNYVNGNSIAIYMGGGDGASFMNNRIKIKNIVKVNHVLDVELSGDAWASINNFDLGYFEGESPQQIYIKKSGTDAFHNNIIKGCGGYPSFWNPTNLSPLWTIRLETDATGKIEGTTFSEFYIYTANDEIYRAIGNVIGTTFVGGMVRSDKTEWWHNAGNVDIISDYIVNTGRATILHPP